MVATNSIGFQIRMFANTFSYSTQQLGIAYVMMQGLQVLKPFSQTEARDIEEALKGDYKNYHERKEDIFVLPNSQCFKDRLENSTFDKMNIESPALKYRFLTPFILKAELNPGLAFSEVLLTLVHIIARKFSCPYLYQENFVCCCEKSNPSIDFSVSFPLF